MILISPSLLAVEITNDQSIDEALARIPSADWLHIDVMDEKAVPNKTIFLEPKITERIRGRTSKTLDVHLMTEKPEEQIEPFVTAGADIISYHIEYTNHPLAVLQEIKTRGRGQGKNIQAGIAINPGTKINDLTKLLEEAHDHNGFKGGFDMVVVMGVMPGACGQSYKKNTPNRIRKIKEFIREKGYKTIIQVDGGVKIDNFYLSTNPGADCLVSGSGVFNQKNSNGAIKKLKDVILIGSDHGGIELKERIKKYLAAKQIAYQDVGTYSSDSCDYPLFAAKIGSDIEQDYAKRGIIICGTGIGMTMAANKFEGVRAALVHNKKTAELSREHNNANVLCLGARILKEETALECVKAWLDTPYSYEQRHQSRLHMVDNMIGDYANLR